MIPIFHAVWDITESDKDIRYIFGITAGYRWYLSQVPSVPDRGTGTDRLLLNPPGSVFVFLWKKESKYQGFELVLYLLSC